MQPTVASTFLGRKLKKVAKVSWQQAREWASKEAVFTVVPPVVSWLWETYLILGNPAWNSKWPRLESQPSLSDRLKSGSVRWNKHMVSLSRFLSQLFTATEWNQGILGMKPSSLLQGRLSFRTLTQSGMGSKSDTRQTACSRAKIRTFTKMPLSWRGFKGKLDAPLIAGG